MCRAHATVRGFVGEIVARQNDERDIVIDMEAGLEHMSRGTGRHVTHFLAVLEPYFRSMETARRVAALAAELGVPGVIAVANKVKDAEDREAVRAFCATHGLHLAAEVPYDPALLEAERAGQTPIDYQPDAPAVAAIQALADKLGAA